MKRRSTRHRACKQVEEIEDKPTDDTETVQEADIEDEEACSKYFKADDSGKLTAEQVLGISDKYMKKLGVGPSSLSDSDSDDSLDNESSNEPSTSEKKNELFKCKTQVKCLEKKEDGTSTDPCDKSSLIPVSPVAKIASKMRQQEKPPLALVSKLAAKVKGLNSNQAPSSSSEKEKINRKRQWKSEIIDTSGENSDDTDFEINENSLRTPKIQRTKLDTRSSEEKGIRKTRAQRSAKSEEKPINVKKEQTDAKGKRNTRKAKEKIDSCEISGKQTNAKGKRNARKAKEEIKKLDSCEDSGKMAPQTTSQKGKSKPGKGRIKPEPVTEAQESDTSSGESDWEEVAEIPQPAEKNQIPDAPVQITLEATDIMKKKKKNGCDIRAMFLRQFKKYQKAVREDMHKVHLLCLVAAGLHQNRICLDKTLTALAYSCCPQKYFKKPSSKSVSDDVHSFMLWFKKEHHIDVSLSSDSTNCVGDLVKYWATKTVPNEKYLILMCVIYLRCLGYDVRIINSLRPMPLKAIKVRKGTQKVSELPQTSSCDKKLSAEDNKTEMLLDLEKETGSRVNSVSSEEKKSLLRTEKSEKVSSKAKTSKKSRDNKKDSGKQARSASRTSSRRKSKKGVSYVPDSENDGSENDEEDDDDFEEESNNIKAKQTNAKTNTKGSTRLKGSANDSDVKIISSRGPAKPRNRRVLSSDSNSSVELIPTKSGGRNIWIELYLEDKQIWLTVDCIHCTLNKPIEIVKTASQPFSYIIGIDNESSVKDVTPRYDDKWMTSTMKLRIDADWCKNVLHPYRSTNADREKAEEDELKGLLLKAPLPKTLSEYKNHPLYALERHLLKFEAIYPETSVPLGYWKKEPVYARECVHDLHARVQWLKNARVVRPGEKPYKVVKGRKTKKRAYETEQEASLECFGLWQTEQYVPPPAVDGKVPRNEFGNVELFQACMLPAGTVHLKLPGLNKIAKKLEIDCAQAMTGWDFHGGWSHPVMDGFVVCEEFKDTLIAAWDEEQEILKEKERQKKEKRVLGNWKLLVRGMQIREHLRKKYLSQPDYEEPQEKKCKKADKKPVAGGSKEATDVVQSWPRIRQKNRKDLELSKINPFPFEQM
ncbi:DNA repair protein complementing XP-C cells homolog [Tubulanus polymorphus]|uniref:DNA repair protein complementing XP-C cells homolog n=1 Tax=Tubulanus polymorphus TaxID=672921 RepID=UPI003DA32A5B